MRVQLTVLHNSKMNEEVLCHPCNLLSFLSAPIKPSQLYQDTWDLLGERGWILETGFLHLNQQKFPKKTEGSYRKLCLYLVISINKGRLEGFSIPRTSWKPLQLLLTLYKIYPTSASSDLCRLHRVEPPLLLTPFQSLFIQHTKHPCNCSNLHT